MAKIDAIGALRSHGSGAVFGKGKRGFEVQRMHEGLWEIAPQLSLLDVVFLGEQSWWAARCAAAFKPSHRSAAASLLLLGECHRETAQQEGAFGIAEPNSVVAEPI